MARTTKTKSGSSSRKKDAGKAIRGYKEAMDYIFSHTDYEKQRLLRYNITTFDLTRMYRLLKEMKNPEKGQNFIHIAGSKGKGSTSTMLARMLEAGGYKVGLYTSPHITSMHERISVNNKHITERQMTALVRQIKPAVDKLAKENIQPTFFELLTAMAFVHFKNQKADYVVLETGLGGRLDSTNVVQPLITAITQISIDHQRQLGYKIEQIAKEKAGIIKEGVPVVTIDQDERALDVIKTEAEAKNAPLWVTGVNVDFSSRFESSREDGPHTRICVQSETSKFEHLKVPLPGDHQALNCGLALTIIDQLKNKGCEIENENIVQGLENVHMPGRMEVVFNEPTVIVDAAHNAASLRALIATIGQHIPYDSLIFIFGCNADKDILGMLDQLQYGADKVIFTRSSSPRAISPDELAEEYNELTGRMCQTSLSLGDALKIAGSAVTRGDVICISGSVYLVGDAIKRFNRIKEAARANASQ
ncbi:bifunctional folylpolyglutamate synthase/dihydrofolate synthase [Sedimentisphaera salicampi]|uniref:bifunctional folylpolyglutamate synthase/dihydrofolate synthase n=1 Tax=Sedimentisphaera salicampi TaxID=1941349 RepID=UPI000B9BEA60|nr:folylpolyglutamate synthase/dihydrofolate synthase family protein [Sedimentisphaera salicampi]OXU14783.1 Folylpolyglutamate synthase [Sedimentisphaera salicampi]